MRQMITKMLVTICFLTIFFGLLGTPQTAKAGNLWFSFGYSPYALIWSSSYQSMLMNRYIYRGYNFPTMGYHRFFHPTVFPRMNYYKIKKDTQTALYLSELKQKEYFALNDATPKTRINPIEPKTKIEFEKDLPNDIDIQIESPNQEFKPIDTKILQNGTVAINYY